MNFVNRTAKKNNDLNFTAMIDVVFLLLIFFICTASLHLPESQIKAALPGRSSSAPEFQPVKVAISASDSGLQIYCDDQPCNGDSDLLEQIAARSILADIPVIFSIADNVEFEDVVHIMDICRQGGLKKLAIPVSN